MKCVKDASQTEHDFLLLVLLLDTLAVLFITFRDGLALNTVFGKINNILTAVNTGSRCYLQSKRFDLISKRSPLVEYFLTFGEC